MEELSSSQGSEDFESRFITVYQRLAVPSAEHYLERVSRVTEILKREEGDSRPRSSDGGVGGLIQLKTEIPTVIVPDLHARQDFLLQLIYHQENGERVMERLSRGSLQTVCVGDGFHAEARAALRWRIAFDEFQGGYDQHEAMDEEMAESLGTMEMVMELKESFPDHFHFLKGNHENILNEEGEGNHPFGKFAFEGEMVTTYIRKFMGDEFLEAYSSFEKALPLMAVGRNFLITHAEPRAFHPRQMVIDGYSHPDVIYDLTWTADDAAEEGSVLAMLEHYLPDSDPERCFIFGGHRPVKERYNLRAEGRYVQIHNPSRYIVAWIKPEGDVDLERDVVELQPAAGIPERGA